MAGTLVLPLLLPTLLSAIISGRLVTKYGNYRLPICIGWTIACVGTGLLIAWYAETNLGFQVVTMIILGCGTGAVLNAQNFACQAMCNPPKANIPQQSDGSAKSGGKSESGQEARAAAMYLFARQFGFALGVAIGGTTFQNVMALKLEWLGLPLDAAQHAEAYINVLFQMPSGPEKTGITDAYTYGFVGCISVFLAVSVVALVLSLLFVEQFDMTTSNDTEHTLEARQVMFRKENS